MRFIISWALVALVLLLCVPPPYNVQVLVAVIAVHLLLWVVLVGGLASMKEVVEAHTQPGLPRTITSAAAVPRRATPRRLAMASAPSLTTVTPTSQNLLVVGAATGLGAACVDLASTTPSGTVWRGDIALPHPEHLDLASPASIASFCDGLHHRGVRRLDQLLLVAGVCDATAVPVPGSSWPRVVWVNFLGYVVLLHTLAARHIVVGRVVLVGSGSYARGGMRADFFPAQWSVLGAVSAYSQSKFLVTAWAAWLQQRGKEVVVINPGPMRSTIGDAHVPVWLWPTYGLLKEVLFPVPRVAAAAVLHYATAPNAEVYVHIRQPAPLGAASVTSASCHAWLLRHTQNALKEVGCSFESECDVR
jgi:NAD(P)-dependent dehydrogenase (short-subunit alcohol dehydrogenase family)